VGKALRSNDSLALNSKPPLGLTLEQRLILVVEDDAAVREGLVVVLQAWGAQVEAHDSVDALESTLALHGAAARQPDLLLVDYRLPQGRTGVEALRVLRAHWPGRHLPAIMITGSSLGGHEDGALEHDYHLLVKPVLPNKLRAMIAFKLGMRSGKETGAAGASDNSRDARPSQTE